MTMCYDFDGGRGHDGIDELRGRLLGMMRSGEIDLLRPWSSGELARAVSVTRAPRFLLDKCSRVVANCGSDILYGGPRTEHLDESGALLLAERGSVESDARFFMDALHAVAHSMLHISRSNDDTSLIAGSEAAIQELAAQIICSLLAYRLGLSVSDEEMAHHIEEHARWRDEWMQMIDEGPYDIICILVEAINVHEMLMEGAKSVPEQMPFAVLPPEDLDDASEEELSKLMVRALCSDCDHCDMVRGECTMGVADGACDAIRRKLLALEGGTDPETHCIKCEQRDECRYVDMEIYGGCAADGIQDIYDELTDDVLEKLKEEQCRAQGLGIYQRALDPRRS